MKSMLERLEKAGKPAVALGERILVSPFGGRILGLYPDGERNVLWMNELLQEDPAAFFAQEGWLNLGGDRTWISPELDVNGNPNEPGDYDVPKTVDPAAFRVHSTEGRGVVLETDLRPFFRSAGAEVPLRMSKRIELLDRHAAAGTALHCAGYALTVTLASSAALPAGAKPGAWNILQVPGGGTIRMPTRAAASPRRFIGQPRCELSEREVTARVESAASFKFGLHAEEARGSMIYLDTRSADQSILILRSCSLHESHAYADVPADAPQAVGYIQQAYVDDGALGGFGEMEYHTPFLKPDGQQIVDRSEVWGFIGSAGAISELAENLIA